MMSSFVITQFLATLLLTATFASEYLSDYGPKLCTDDVNLPIFHMIVCGAGSAGSTLASRLSEENSWNVLLLEKGDDPPDLTDIPLLWARLLKSPIDYQYVSQPDEHYFKGLDGGISSIPRGKVSGGCSSINVAMYIRGNRHDFDAWEANGCTGWSYNDVLKYFLKAEDYQNADKYDATIHSIGGPLGVARYKSPDPAVQVFTNAFQEVGIVELADLNDGTSLGFGISDSTTRQGLRSSTFKAYLPRAKLKRNLFFARNTSVRKVIFEDGPDGVQRAVGVEITAVNGKKCTVRAEIEVILSLGAIASPQILMLSGVGPKDHLTTFGIPLIVDAPVGHNYMDHPVYIGTVFSDRKQRTPDEIDFDSKKLANETYSLFGQSIPTIGMSELVAFLDTTGENVYPDVQLMTMRLSYGTMMKTDNKRHKLYNMFGLSERTAALFTEINDQSDTIFVLVIVCDTKSSGVIELASTDPDTQPKIDTRLLHDEDEVATMLRGVRFAEKLGRTEAFKRYGFQTERINYENCVQFEGGTDEYYKCAFQQIVTGFYHPGCTVKMGREDDASAVLNPRLQVKGVTGLRVIDASSMYRMVSANPNAAVIMIGEKGADMIKEDYNKPTDYATKLF